MANGSELYRIFKLGEQGYLLENDDYRSKRVAYLVNDMGAFAVPNNPDLSKYVVGSMGSPTVELFVASYKEKTGVSIDYNIVDDGYDVGFAFTTDYAGDGLYCR